MAGETLGFKGAYTVIITTASVADAAFSAESTAISTALSTGNESDYPLLDFQLEMDAGVPVTGDVVHLYRRPSDGTNKAPAPVSDYKQQYVGTFTLDNAAADQYYYLSDVDNHSPESTYYLEADTNATLDYILAVRARTYKAAT